MREEILKLRVLSVYSIIFLVFLNCGKGIRKSISETIRFRNLSEEVLENYFEFYPVQASEKGVHRYDHLLSNYTPYSIAQEIKKLQDYQLRLKEIDVGSLEIDDQIDYELLSSNIDMYLWNLAQLKEWERNPVLYVDECIYGIYFLLISTSIPLESKIISIEKRLFQIPRLLKEAKENVKNPPRVFVDIALNKLETGIEFFEESISDIAHQFPLDSPMLTTAKLLAVEAMKDYGMHLDSLKEIVDGDFAIGKEFFEYKLNREYLLKVSSEELLALGERFLRDSKTRMERAESSHSMESRLEPPSPYLLEDEFSKMDILKYYNWEIDDVRTFCENNEIVSIPQDIGECQVFETPSFLQGIIPGVAYLPPPPFDSLQSGIFYVRPIPEEFSEDERQGYSKMVRNREFRGSVVHEAFPGHHLQLSLANRFPSRIRKYQQSSLFTEGWAFYCEEMMVREGLYDGDEDVIGTLWWAAFRAARVILDVKLQIGEYDFEEGVKFLVDNFGEDNREYFEKEVKRYCLTPTQPMSYLTGKIQIEDLRKKVKKEMGDEFTSQQFHDMLLAEGSIPLELVEKKIMHKLKTQ
jgi:uncharacterized protein (DUF885 family)